MTETACGCHEPAVFGHRCAAWTPRPKPEPVLTAREEWLARNLAARLRQLAGATHG